MGGDCIKGKDPGHFIQSPIEGDVLLLYKHHCLNAIFNVSGPKEAISTAKRIDPFLKINNQVKPPVKAIWVIFMDHGQVL